MATALITGTIPCIGEGCLHRDDVLTPGVLYTVLLQPIHLVLCNKNVIPRYQ